MKIVFNGVLEFKSGGCIPCGRKRASKKSLTTKKDYILPSGRTVTFYLGRAEDVSDSDGEFLLSYNSSPDLGGQKPFTKVG